MNITLTGGKRKVGFGRTPPPATESQKAGSHADSLPLSQTDEPQPRQLNCNERVTSRFRQRLVAFLENASHAAEGVAWGWWWRQGPVVVVALVMPSALTSPSLDWPGPGTAATTTTTTTPPPGSNQYHDSLAFGHRRIIFFARFSGKTRRKGVFFWHLAMRPNVTTSRRRSVGSSSAFSAINARPPWGNGDVVMTFDWVLE